MVKSLEARVANIEMALLKLADSYKLNSELIYELIQPDEVPDNVPSEFTPVYTCVITHLF